MEAKPKNAADPKGANSFSMRLLETVIETARLAGYKFVPLEEMQREPQRQRQFSIRLDLDFKPQTLLPFVELGKRQKIPFTLFVRVNGPYNPLWYTSYSAIAAMASAGAEIGLHTNCVEWAAIHGIEPGRVLAAELNLLKEWFEVKSIAPHRDVNYMHNTLPWLEQNWTQLSKQHGLKYHAYDAGLLRHALYVNEGLSPHLSWRGQTPFEAIETGKPIYMLLHPHWWWVDHPFERD